MRSTTRLPWSHRLAVPTLVALLAGTAACTGSAATSGIGGSPVPAPPSTTPSGTSSTSPSGTDAKGAATPEALMTTFVTDVLQQHYRKACLLNAAPPNSNLDPAKVCASPEATKTLTSLRSGWAKPGIALPPKGKVTVDKVTPTGDTATVADTGISLDGHTLNALMLIGSHNAEGFGVKWTLQRKQERWFIGEMNLGN
ncbi:hypothetical protein [Amycolatopsis sp. NBC_01480]|uniref:hypothetical protein n=1 Tax=Amycolatopsis sp. NBC_01480 TaxID=2903562 RepID=UPI002E289830|nr:hypothetical protein [Amycolatopsis sp. NBC_01480]